MKKRNDLLIMYYRCCVCNKQITIPRQKGRLRGEGHIKDLWCPYCKVDSKFSEIGVW